MLIREELNENFKQYTIELYFDNILITENSRYVLDKKRLNINYDVNNDKIIRTSRNNWNSKELQNFRDNLYRETKNDFTDIVERSTNNYFKLQYQLVTRSSNSYRLNNEDYISYALYVDINTQLRPESLNVTTDIFKQLSLDKTIIRFANHISKQEAKTLHNPNLLILNTLYAIDKEENEIYKLVSNVVKSRYELIQYLQNYKNGIITSIDQIETEIINRCRKYKQQGNF